MIKTTLRFIYFVLLTSSVFTVKAQQLDNTRWMVIDDSLFAFQSFWNFSNDTLAISPDNISWTYLSVYDQVAINIVTFRDIENGLCDSTVTGVYQIFFINQDTMQLSKLTEACASRSDYITTHYYVNFPIGINDLEMYKNVSIFPVPFTNELNVKADGYSFDFSLRDITGRKVIVRSIHDFIHINTTDLEPGMYLYELSVAGKVVKSGTAVKY